MTALIMQNYISNTAMVIPLHTIMAILKDIMMGGIKILVMGRPNTPTVWAA
jgi:hypothetical protein